MTEADELQSAIALGFSAEDFLASELGKYIANRAEEQRTNALESLSTHNPYDAEGISALQFKVAVADAAAQWLADAIIMGRQAQARMQQLDYTD